ncbi:hypothetical protein AB0D73_34715 [Streptomyces sp. NPDC048215]|uniref:hypothetical protein n=1 Tax=Streptomyces TaxID=1883 RepID=UPI002E127647|nr:hypothetical protein OG483_00065 [[Kitasatospora] papulosa]WSK32507.1 hypothetical protein OG483_33470 [[Kitasatospora] papulosa]
MTARQARPRTRALALCGAVGLSLALTGCGGSSDDTKPPTVLSTPSSAAPSVSASPADPDTATKAAVLEVYSAMWVEQMKPYRVASPDGTKPADFATLDALSAFERDLATMKKNNTRVMGGVGHEPEVTELDLEAKVPTAVVEDCVDLSKWRAERTSGEVIPLPTGPSSWSRPRGSDEGAVYKVQCDSGRGGVVFVPTGQAGPGAPTIDPETVARKAAASMRLDGPKVVSPRAAGTYVVGMPMWMWAEPSSSTFGPVSASATAGGVTVTATAKVTRVRWAMGDGASVTCHGPGTPYRKSREVTESPDCGHLYERPSYEEPGGRYRGTVTAAWTITWSAPRPGRRRDVHRDPADAVHGRCPRGPGRQHPLTCPGAFPR